MVRDLDKLRTRSEFRLRTGHLALIIVATAAAVGLLFAVGSAVTGGRSDDAPKAPAADPFAGLEGGAPVKVARAEAPVAVPDPESLAPLQLSFHERLGQPESAAMPALPAAAPLPAAPATEDPAAEPLPIDVPAALRPAPPVPAAPADQPLPAPLAPPPVARPVVRAAVPPPAPAIAVAPAPVQSVREPMAPALPPGSPEPRFDEEQVPALAQAGEHGVFTLQISSFSDQDEAVAFMNMLRQRGHESFLVRASCAERGTVYRVRVGPFESQAEAERYRRKFERTERIPTFVVRRTLPTSG